MVAGIIPEHGVTIRRSNLIHIPTVLKRMRIYHGNITTDKMFEMFDIVPIGNSPDWYTTFAAHKIRCTMGDVLYALCATNLQSVEAAMGLCIANQLQEADANHAKYGITTGGFLWNFAKYHLTLHKTVTEIPNVPVKIEWNLVDQLMMTPKKMWEAINALGILKEEISEISVSTDAKRNDAIKIDILYRGETIRVAIPRIVPDGQNDDMQMAFNSICIAIHHINVRKDNLLKDENYYYSKEKS